jgi:hypothetical protein
VLLLPGIDPEATSTPLCAKVAGFSLHAARVVDASDRAGLERLCRYGLRAPFSQERLRLREDGRVVYQLRRPWPNAAGATCLVLEPVQLLRRLAALVPAPYTNLVRYHGLFAGRSQWRPRLPAPPNLSATGATGKVESRSAGEPDPARDGASAQSPPCDFDRGPRRRVLPWAQLLLRVFFVDALRCPRCSSAMVVLALISHPRVLRKILLHLGLPVDGPPVAPAAHRRDEGLLFDECDDPCATSARSPP